MSEIVKGGNRIHSGFCISCGTTLISPYNDYQCCSVCTGKIERCRYQTKMDPSIKKDRKGAVLLDKRRIKKQIAPIGGTV